MAFRVGQKVVCVDDRPPDFDSRRLIELGEVYEISEVFETGLSLIEVSPHPAALWFRKTRFRPIVSTDTGMAVLEQIRRDVTNKILRPIFEDEQV